MAEDTRRVAQQFSDLYGPHFAHGEFRCKCATCQAMREIDSEWFTTSEFRAFMKKLMKMRSQLGFPFQINSGYRCPAYNDGLYQGDGTHLDGPHTKGAADLGASFERAYKITKLASSLDMGVGLSQKGDVAARYIHVDNLGPRIWTY